MSTPPKPPVTHDSQFDDDWEGALDEWDTKFAGFVGREPGVAAPASPASEIETSSVAPLVANPGAADREDTLALGKSDATEAPASSDVDLGAHAAFDDWASPPPIAVAPVLDADPHAPGDDTAVAASIHGRHPTEVHLVDPMMVAPAWDGPSTHHWAERPTEHAPAAAVPIIMPEIPVADLAAPAADVPLPVDREVAEHTELHPAVPPPTPALPPDAPSTMPLASSLPEDAPAPIQRAPSWPVQPVLQVMPALLMGAATVEERAADPRVEALLAAHADDAGANERALLDCAAARRCERSGDSASARELYLRALAAQPDSLTARRGVRRIAVTAGDATSAIKAIEAELEVATHIERPALDLLRAELQMATGDVAAARSSYATAAASSQTILALWAASALADLPADADGAVAADEALARGTTDGVVRGALLVEAADLAGGDGSRAAALVRSALVADPASQSAALTLFQLAAHADSSDAELAALEHVEQQWSNEPQLASLRTAARRRIARLLLEGGDPTKLARAATLLERATDRASLELRLRIEERLGSVDAASMTLHALAALHDGDRRSDRLVRAAELEHRAGDITKALRTAKAALEASPASSRALAIVGRLASLAGERLPELLRGASDELVARRAKARLLADAGDCEAALEALGGTSTTTEGTDRDALMADGPRLRDVVELLRARGRHREAASILARSAKARRAADRLAADLDGLEAARLYLRAGAAEEGAATSRALADGPLANEARRLRIDALEAALATTPSSTSAMECAALLEAEAATRSPGRHAAVLHARRARVLEGADPTGAANANALALTLDAELAQALVALELRGHHAEAATAGLRRFEATTGSARVASGLRAAHALERSGDLKAAAACYGTLVAESAPEAALVIGEGLADLARRAGDVELERTILARELVEADAPTRFRSTLRRAERCVRERRADEALTLFREASLLEPHNAVVREGFERALLSTGRYSELAEHLRAEIDGQTEVRARVRAYEKLARLEVEHFGREEAAFSLQRAILEQDHAHQRAFRTLELRYLAGGRDADLVTLYEGMGLSASNAGFATALILESARMREQLGGDRDAIESNYRRALFKDPICRPAMRNLLRIAFDRSDQRTVAELGERLAASWPMPSTSTGALWTRAGEARASLRQFGEAVADLRAASARGGMQAPWLRSLVRAALAANDPAVAVESAELAATAALDAEDRVRARLVAGSLASERLDQRDRALAAFRGVLRDRPGHPDAADRLATLLERGGEIAERTEILTVRAAAERNPARAAALHNQLAQLHRDGGAPELASHHLRRSLHHDPANSGSLLMLADAYEEAGDWQQTADTLIRRARSEKDPLAAKETWLRLGLLYASRLPDPERAIVSLRKVIEVDPNHAVALDQLASVYRSVGDTENALASIWRLVAITSGVAERIALLIRAGGIQEAGIDGERVALETYRRALGLDPQNLDAITAITGFFERHRDAVSARVLLDTTIQSQRQLVARDPIDPAPYHVLFHAFQLRRSIEQSKMAASVLVWMHAESPVEEAWLDRFPVREGNPLRALSNVVLDENLYPQGVPAGMRNIFRLLDEPLQRAFRGDVKRLGVSRSDRVPRVHVVREAANQVAAALGLREPDLYLSSTDPAQLAIELTDPISIVIGERVVAGASAAELRFFFARMLRPLHAKLAVPLRMSPDELGVLMGGLVRQFVPDYAPTGFDVSLVAAEAARMARVLPRRLHQDLMPFALECADPAIDWRRVSRLITDSANRAGMIAAGSIGSALTAVRRLDDEKQLGALLEFAVSDEYKELRELVGDGSF